ncbi:MAG: DUF2206 domain-containing protein [Candidatus Bathyarchaeota archaeon]|nr:DUF2206 domain-containing protein [Candidatus Bathyarchaeota archaeon]
MSSMLAKWKSKDFLLVILFLQSTVYATVFFDVPVARQVIGFLYLTFVPGFVIIKLLKLDELGGLETILFSVGLSVAFLMIAGLLINEFCFLLGISQPLSLMPLTIILNSLILIGGVLIYLRSDDVNLFGAETLGLSPLVLLLIIPPIFSIMGAILVNTYENNLILLVMIIAISLLFIGVISKKRLPPKLYPFAVLMIAISLLFHSSLISNYLVSFGSDVPVEYFVLKTTEIRAYWNSSTPVIWDIGYGRTNAMLSVTILPTIYSTFLNIDPAWVFKILFPLIFSFVPLGLYQVWRAYIGKKLAFISTFLFMTQLTFYTEMLGLNRQIVAELFFVLLLLVMLNKKMKPVNRMMCFMILSFALVTSHYGLAEIFLFFISFSLISLVVLKRQSRNMTVSMVVFFFVVMFTWYIYTSSSTVFDSFLSFSDYVYRQLGDFFNPTSRGQTVLTGLGLIESPSIWNTISRAFAYLTQALIAVGFVGLVTKRTRFRFDKEYFAISIVAMAFLAALILVPGLANTMNMTRFYHILLFFLAPFCILGGEVIVNIISKREKELVVSVLLLTVLVPYFLFQTGFIYEVTGSDNWSVPLSKHRMTALRLYGNIGYMDGKSVSGALWLSKNVDVENSRLYADGVSRNNVLTIYGMVYRGYVYGLSNTTIVADNGTVYLSTLNVVDGVIVSGSRLWNSSELSFRFDSLNRIYSNGACEIYRNMPTMKDS